MLMERRVDDAVVPVDLNGTEIEGWEKTDFAIRKQKNQTGKQIAELILGAYRHRYPEQEESVSKRSSTTATTLNADSVGKPMSEDGVRARSNSLREKPAEQIQPSQKSLKSTKRSTKHNTNADGLDKLRRLTTRTLKSDELRNQILRFNKFPDDWSASQLAAKLIDSRVTSDEIEPGQTPIDYLYCCLDDDLRRSEYWPDLCREMIRLTALLTPVSFVVDQEAVASHIDPTGDRRATHVHAETTDPILAKSLPAMILGAAVDFEDYEIIVELDNDAEHYVPIKKKRNLVSGVVAGPEVGIEGKGLIENIAIGLAKKLKARNSTIAAVNGALDAWADSNSYVSLMLKDSSGQLVAARLKSISEKFPELIVLILAGGDDAMSESVLYKIQEIRQFFDVNATQGRQ